MRFGTCVGFDKLESAAKLGYDYLESNLGHIKSLSEQELKNTKAMLDGYGAKLEAANCFFPGEIRLAGEDADIEIIRDYTRRAFDNAVFLGIKTCVLGSGRSRSVPDGFDRENGLEQIHSALRVIDDEAGEHGIRVAIEPLNRLETNVFTTVRESVDICRALGLKNIFVLADIYHMVMENEDLGALRYAGDKLIHIHFSNPTARDTESGKSKRVYPAEGDGYDYTPFVSVVKNAGYDGRISIEAGCTDFEKEAAAGLKMMRKLFG